MIVDMNTIKKSLQYFGYHICIFGSSTLWVSLLLKKTYRFYHIEEVSTIEVKVLPDDEEFLTEIEPSVQHMVDVIASIDVQLLPMYQGAIDAITSNNVDHVRHATTSLRELFTQILHKLAPDEAFFKWNQDELNLDNGRPTRKGRLLNICRNINCDPFKAFVDQDILAALAFLDLVQKGTPCVFG